MKRQVKKTQKVTKGVPSAVLLSIVIHVGLFLLAGMLVVFTVVKKEEKKFEPPKAVERPKMKLKKPKVKVRKTSKPKPTTRIVTKMDRTSMPDIQLPEMSGMGAGLGDMGVGGFDLMPDLDEISVFGEGQTIGNDFVGVFYDTKRNRAGGGISHGRATLTPIIERFFSSGWNKSKLAKYYQSPQKLYTTTFAFPADQSIGAPAAFGVDTIGWCWVVHYEGQLVYPEDITFRFWGHGDDILAVRVNGEMVLLSVTGFGSSLSTFWRSTSANTHKYAMGNGLAVVGDWITLTAGEPLDMEVLVAEIPGGNFCAILCVEVEGVEYPKNPFMGGPTLPVFKTAEPSLDLTEAIHNMLDPGDASVTNGPVFRDYFVNQEYLTNRIARAESVEEVEPKEIDYHAMRTWIITDGKTLEAEYVVVIGDKVVLRTDKGKQIRIPYMQLCAEDRDFIDLARPPKFDMDFIKTSSQIMPPKLATGSWYRDIRTYAYEFGVRLKQRSAGTYNQELEVEYFAVGEEVDGDNYVLLERKKFVFNPANSQEHEFRSEKKVKVESKELVPGIRMRGNKYGGYLITVTDAHGKIIQHQTSNKFLYENLGNLKRLSVGRHFNRLCKHVGPPRPDKRDRP